MAMTGVPQYEFEWDPEKARANLEKHGVSFEDAAGIFLDPHASSLFDEDHADREERWVTLGTSRSGRLLVTSHTFHDLGEGRYRIRLISARKATRAERRTYEEG
jgi:uncharacterized DUF497 family protein